MKRAALIVSAVWVLTAAEPTAAIFRRAAAALGAGDYNTAERGFQQVLKASPGNIAALGNLGVVYTRTNRLVEAERVYRAALQLRPDDKDLLLNLGLVEYTRERFTRALPLFARAVRQGAPNSHARELLAACQLRTGQVEAAAKTLESLRAENPRAAAVLSLLAAAYFRDDQPEKAAQTIADLRASASTAAQGDFLSGKAYEDGGRFDEAAEAFLQALHDDPNYPAAHLELGRTYLSAGQKEKAKLELAMALREDIEDAAAHYTLGSLLVEEGHYLEGIAHLEEATRLNPDFWRPYEPLARALKARGRDAEAEQALARFRALQ